MVSPELFASNLHPRSHSSQSWRGKTSSHVRPALNYPESPYTVSGSSHVSYDIFGMLLLNGFSLVKRHSAL